MPPNARPRSRRRTWRRWRWSWQLGAFATRPSCAFPLSRRRGRSPARAHCSRELGALDAEGAVTAHGRAMAELPIHPRLAHMLLTARAHGMAPTALAVAALLGTRNVDRGDADFARRLAELRGGDAARIRRQLARALGEHVGEPQRGSMGAVLSLAFPERWPRPGPVHAAPSAWPMAAGHGWTPPTSWPAKLGWRWPSSTMPGPRRASGWRHRWAKPRSRNCTGNESRRSRRCGSSRAMTRWSPAVPSGSGHWCCESKL